MKFWDRNSLLQFFCKSSVIGIRYSTCIVSIREYQPKKEKRDKKKRKKKRGKNRKENRD